MPNDDTPEVNPIPIAVVGAPRPFREALLEVAAPGEFRFEAPDDPREWANEEGSRVLVAVISKMFDWTDMESYASLPGLITVVVTPDLGVEDFVRALIAGSDGVVHADTTARIIMSVVSAAARGEVVLPAEAARMMAKRAERGKRATPLSHEELQILRELSEGLPLVQLAHEFAWSERTLRRRLHNACLKLGVSNRAQAIAKAGQLGLLD